MYLGHAAHFSQNTIQWQTHKFIGATGYNRQCFFLFYAPHTTVLFRESGGKGRRSSLPQTMEQHKNNLANSCLAISNRGNTILGSSAKQVVTRTARGWSTSQCPGR